MAKQEIVLGGGCFWCLEASFKILKGVISVDSGYANGNLSNPSYRDICSGNSGHAEVVKITFDDTIIQYDDILNIFFSIHDPTTEDRQGADIGSQYRSIILFQNEEEEEMLYEIIDEKQDFFTDEIVTIIEELDFFYIAENYHQNYLEKNPTKTYCKMIIEPKIAKVCKEYPTIVDDTF